MKCPPLQSPPPEQRRLKEFQQASADFIVQRFLDKQPRYLLADEVGLGKTEIARDVITQLHRDWKKRNPHARKPFVVLYMASSQQLCAQNIPRLSPLVPNRQTPSDGRKMGETIRQSELRLTLLPLMLDRLMRNSRKVLILPITPKTFFIRSNRYGRKRERALLNLLLGGGTPSGSWRRSKRSSYREVQNIVRKELRHGGKRYSATVRNRLRYIIHLHRWEDDKNEKELLQLLVRRRRKLKRNRAGDVLGALRTALATIVLEILDPQLIILDEFQRFRDDIYPRRPQEKAAARRLDTRRVDNKLRDILLHNHRLLLLSATPYTLYDAEGVDRHKEDFYEIVRFLSWNGERTSGPDLAKEVEEQFKAYDEALRELRKHLRQTELGKDDVLGVWHAKEKLELSLKRVLLRTERSTYQHEAVSTDEERIGSRDCANAHYRAFRSLYELLKCHTDQWTILEWWRSGSHWLSFMEGLHYRTIQRSLRNLPLLTEGKNGERHREALFYGRKELEEYRVKCTNSRMKALKDALLQMRDDHVDLWVPPLKPSWGTTQERSKILVFAGWRFVPRQLSFVLSASAAEKGGWGAGDSNPHPTKVFDFNRGSRLSFAPLELVYPCRWLAEAVNPPLLVQTICDERQTSAANVTISEMYKAASDRIRKLLNERNSEFSKHAAKTPRKPRAKTWQLLLALDADLVDAEEFIKTCRPYSVRTDLVKKIAQNLGQDPSDMLSQITETQVNELARIALGSPATLLMRTLLHLELLECKSPLTKIPFRSNPDERKRAARDTAEVLDSALVGFSSFFTKPYAISIILGKGIRRPATRRDIADYCAANLFGDVLDEYCYLAKEQLGDTADRMQGVLNTLKLVLTSQQGRVFVRYGPRHHDLMPRSTNFARSFSDLDAHDDDNVKQKTKPNQLLESFNSPFWPMCLVTTSVGQEGLDFHRYCSTVVHWNLPSDPIAVEQREGRIQRYNSFEVRSGLSMYPFNPMDPLKNVWEESFTQLKKDWGDHQFGHGMFPNWLPLNRAKTGLSDNDQRLETRLLRRLVLPLEYSEIEKKHNDVRRLIAMYRLVLGQRAQRTRLEDLENGLTDEQIRKLRRFELRLSPIDARGARDSALRHAQDIVSSRDDFKAFLEYARQKLEFHGEGGHRGVPGVAEALEVFKRLIAVDLSGRRRQRYIRDVEALYYFLDPFDAKPDDTPGLGYVDDIQILGARTRKK